jgi:Anti-sigma-K factor rskA
VNVKEYISSGIVESYVLGLATEQEAAEFEKNCAAYPEVLEARLAFEKQIEDQAIQNAIAPASGLKDKIWNTLQDNSSSRVVSITKNQPPVRNLNWLKYAVAACLILLAGSAYWNYSLYNENINLAKNNDSVEVKLAAIEKEIDQLKPNDRVKLVSLKGTPEFPQAMTTIYWDSTSHDVYLLINNLPKPASDKQYQIWALLDGQPIDLGMIENEYFIQQKSLLVKAKNVEKAQAFAITLEKKGGNPTPQGKMIVLGNL